MTLSRAEQPAEAPIDDDLYAELGVTRRASMADITAGYRRRSKVTHPDRPTGSQEAWERTALAYAVLGDPARRLLYDETGTYKADAVDTRKADALSALARILQMMIGLAGIQQTSVAGALGPPVINAEFNDLVAKARQFANDKIVQLDIERCILETRLEAARIMRDRFVVKEKGDPDPVRQLLEAEMDTIKDDLVSNADIAAPLPLVIEMLGRYRYEHEHKDPPRPVGGIRVDIDWGQVALDRAAANTWGDDPATQVEGVDDGGFAR